MTILETVRWNDGKVRILDQTLLPSREIYRDLSTPDEVGEAIRTLAVRGAPAIGVAGAYAVALAARSLAAPNPATARETAETAATPHPGAASYLRALEEITNRVVAVRPTAVNLRWACERVLRHLRVFAADSSRASGDSSRASADSSRTSADSPRTSTDSFAHLAEEALHEADRILHEDLALSRAMAGHGAALLPMSGRVISHCNTGGLATAGGGTALALVFEAVDRGKKIFVHVDETRPLLQGARLTSWELARAGIPYAVHCDGAAAWLMKTHRIDAVLVGADRVAANGDTANKIGTLSAALAAKEFGVPFYVVAPSSSFDLSLPSGDAIPIEERAAAEVLEYGGVRWTPEGASAWNPAFDVTPAKLITAWITERGVVKPPFAGG